VSDVEFGKVNWRCSAVGCPYVRPKGALILIVYKIDPDLRDTHPGIRASLLRDIKLNSYPILLPFMENHN